MTTKKMIRFIGGVRGNAKIGYYVFIENSDGSICCREVKKSIKL
jgi:hypothetical protein